MIPRLSRHFRRSARRPGAGPSVRPNAAHVGAASAGNETLEDRTLLAAFVVDQTGDDAAAEAAGVTLREALLDAEANGEADTITFDPSVMTITLESDLRGMGLTQTGGVSITDAEGVTLEGASFAGLALTGSGVSYTLSGLTFQNFAADDAGPADNSGNSGGALFISGATVEITDSAFDLNSATRAGGAIEVAGAAVVTITDTDFAGNFASVNGGALHVTGGGAATVTIDGGTIENNTADQEGGGLWNSADGTLIVRNGAVVTGNVASGNASVDDDGPGPGMADTSLLQGGGGIFNDGGTLTIDGSEAEVEITDNSADGMGGMATMAGGTTTPGSGGGVMSIAGTVSINDAVISGNDAERAGGGIELVEGDVTLTNVTLGDPGAGNTAGVNGGGLHMTGAADVTLDGGSVFNNTAAAEGGGLWVSQTGSLTIIGNGEGGNVSVRDNIASGALAEQGGGGIFVDGDGAGAGGTLTIVGDPFDTASGTSLDVFITNNEADGAAGSGGGIQILGGTSMITGANIQGNDAQRAGGGLEIVNANVTVSDSVIQLNDVATGAMPGNGGGVHVGGGSEVTLSTTSVVLNSAVEGGGLWVGGGSTLNVNQSSVGAAGTEFGTASPFGNTATEDGGGIYNAGGTLNVVASTIAFNVAGDGGTGVGGGIGQDGGTTTLTNSTVSDNSAADAGGGIDVAGGTITLDSVTVADNAGDDTGNQIAIDAAATATATNSIFADGDSDSAAGEEADDIEGTFAAGSDYNLTSDEDNGNFDAGDTNNVFEADPMLTVLDDNGGPTLTRLPMDGSPVVDAGETTLAEDQRGTTRPLFAADDIGAVESTAGDLGIGEVIFISDGMVAPPANPNGGGVTVLTPTAGQNLTVDVSDYEDGVSAIIMDASAASLNRLTILGDDASNELTVTIDDGAEAGGLRFFGADGDETVTLNGSATGLSFFGGDGDDTFTMGMNASITTLGTLTVNGEGGDDTLSLTDVTARRINANAGDGDDTLTLTDSDFSGTVNLQGGGGGDAVTVTGVTAGGNVGVNASRGGDGEDTITLDDVTAGGTIAVLTGGEGDTVTLSNLEAGRLNADVGDGDDTLTLSDSEFRGTVNVQAGGGGDEVTLTGVDARGSVGVNASRGDGGGMDVVSLDDVFAGNVMAILTGEDGDDVDLTEVSALRYNVRLAGGGDDLDVTGAVVRSGGRNANFQLGEGDDTANLMDASAADSAFGVNAGTEGMITAAMLTGFPYALIAGDEEERGNGPFTGGVTS